MGLTDREFFDHLYVLWARTTGAEDRYWRPLDDARIVAVGGDDSHEWVAAGLSQPDADWICAMHGCLPDLVRRLHAALDEADRLDRERDDLVGRVVELERRLS